MKELFEAAISSINIIPTFLLVLILVYWLTVIIGMLDFSFLDFDVDVDADADVDVDVDVHAEVDTEVHTEIHAEADAHAEHAHINVGWFNFVLLFFNLGKVPFMVFMSFLVFPMWVISVMINHQLGNTSFIFSLLLLIPNLFISLFAAKILTTPFVKIFKQLDDHEVDLPFEGSVGTVIINVSHDRFGQIEVIRNNSPIILHAITHKGVQIKKEEKALIIDHLKDQDLYLIEPYEEL